ncbi:MAG: deoxyribonuclease V [Anaerolineales bacterium]|jgi:deoxyribonuclease V
MAPMHAWSITPTQAIEVQSWLRERLVLSWDNRELASIAGADVHLRDKQAHAAIVLLSYPALDPIHAVTATSPLTFPYIPGLLAFREGPAFLAAWHQLTEKPDLVIFDGQGIAHPRGVGLASHMGLHIQRPTIGVAKSRLCGHYDPPGPNRGDCAPLRHEDDPSRIIGSVVRTRQDVRPLYVSPGHLIDLQQSVRLVLRCCTRYRLPEPTRIAHRLAAGKMQVSQLLDLHRRTSHSDSEKPKPEPRGTEPQT